MQRIGANHEASQEDEERAKNLSDVAHWIEHAAHLLPAQGPIKIFIHHNTLHAFEHMPFCDAVEAGGRTFGCHAYLPEDRYREELASGRIRREDLVAVLLEDLGDEADRLIGLLGTRFSLRLMMLQYPLRLAPPGELRWYVAQTDALVRFRGDAPTSLREQTIRETRHWILRDWRNGGVRTRNRRIDASLSTLLNQFDVRSMEQWPHKTWESFCLHALWRVCHQGVHGLRATPGDTVARVRLRDGLLETTGQDSDLLVHEVLIRFCSAFLDQGIARWTLPHRSDGFFQSFCTLYGGRLGPPERWMRGLRAEIQRLRARRIGPLESIDESLNLLGVRQGQREQFLQATLLALRGFAGMIWQMESRADRAVHPAPRGSLVEFVAVRLILERLALSYLAKETLGYAGPLADLPRILKVHATRHPSVDVDQRAFLLFQLSQVLGWKPADLYRFSKEEWSMLAREVEAFSSLERRRIFHLAYERRYRLQTLDALATRAARGHVRPTQPRFQAVFCIDEREESFRRHLEEAAPEVETFGTAGFFNVAMYYRGASEAHYVPLCPVVVLPRHYVQEVVPEDLADEHTRRGKIRRWLGVVSHRFHLGSRTAAGGAMLTGLIGPLATIPLVARVLFPRATARLRKHLGRFMQPPPRTVLRLLRSDPEPGQSPSAIGYLVEEMADIVERTLGDLGLTSELARIVVIVGHGSSSLNNPHESAHDCGACGGNRGGPNARAFARMANDPRVRKLLSDRGLVLAADVVFLAAQHNTCDDSVEFYDLDRLPESHHLDFEFVRASMDEARQRNAHERCRRFESAPLRISKEAALVHVEGRAEDLSQVRPEYGHATNSVCIVGRRSRTRGLFLDRRAFLSSYDPTRDDQERTVLTRILQAVVPVCAGINLEYYFSFVDPTGYGCGTKLPHNITSLLGVMDGAASDLRPGLPWQMTEIHEPVRLLMVVETTPEAMCMILDRNEGIARLIRHGWVQLAVLDPENPTIRVYRDGVFEPYEPESNQLPEVGHSDDWYRGWREHLGYALVHASNGPLGSGAMTIGSARHS